MDDIDDIIVDNVEEVLTLMEDDERYVGSTTTNDYNTTTSISETGDLYDDPEYIYSGGSYGTRLTTDDSSTDINIGTNIINDTKIYAEVPSGGRIGKYRRKNIPNIYRTGNKPKNAPYEASLRSLVDIPVPDDIPVLPEISEINLEPLTRLNYERLVSNNPKSWYPLPYLKTIVNSTGITNIPSSNSDRKYIVHVILEILETNNIEI